MNIVDESNTATYLAVLNENGDLHTAIADMGVLEQIPVPDEEVSTKMFIWDVHP